MVQLRSILVPADNSGAKAFAIIGVPGRYGKKATVGQVVKAVVKGGDPDGAVKNKEKVEVVIVRTRKEVRRPDGSYIRFDDNAAVVLNPTGEMRGTRVFGPVARELRDKQFMKIVSLAQIGRASCRESV